MPIKLLIADKDSDYAQHLSNVLATKYTEEYTVELCTSADSLAEQLTRSHFDVALFGGDIISSSLNFDHIRLPLLLVDPEASVPLPAWLSDIARLHKFRRISTLSREILERYAHVAPPGMSSESRAAITAVFSPAGGSGCSSVAVALAIKAAANGKKALYLSLEHFSSVHSFFAESGKSISYVLGKVLPGNDVNIGMLLSSIKLQDPLTGVSYLSMPENYSDVQVLEADEVELLIASAADRSICEELIIDLPASCGAITNQAFAMADRICIVTEPTANANAKLQQFVGQNDLYIRIQSKAQLFVNKSTGREHSGEYGSFAQRFYLPHAPSTGPLQTSQLLAGQLPEGN